MSSRDKSPPVLQTSKSSNSYCFVCSRTRQTVPGYKSMIQCNLSPGQKDTRASTQELLNSFWNHSRRQTGQQGWVGVAVYSKTSALKLISRFLPVNTMILLHQTFTERSYWVPHLEYFNTVFVGLGKVQSDRLEDANYYILRTLFGGLRMKATKAYWISRAWILRNTVVLTKLWFANVLTQKVQSTLPIF